MVSAIKAAVIDIEKRVVTINAYRKEASRLVSLANKRVQRLELSGLTDSPAYKAYIASGGKFGVRGKSHNELQQEVARLNRFINSTTSTIKGVNKTLKEMADNTGISYRDLKELRAKSSKFFELANKVEQYLRTVDDMASAIGYQKIWETINTYVKRGDIDLGDADNDVDNMVDVVTKAIKEYERPDVNQFSNWYKIRED